MLYAGKFTADDQNRINAIPYTLLYLSMSVVFSFFLQFLWTTVRNKRR